MCIKLGAGVIEMYQSDCNENRKMQFLGLNLSAPYFNHMFLYQQHLNNMTSPCIRNPRPQCARQSKPCYPVNHLPFHRKQCISVVRVDLPRRKEAIKVFIREVNSNKYIINTVLPSSYT